MTGTESSRLSFSDPQPVIEVTHKGKKRTFIVVDPAIAERLGLSEDTCRFSQSITDGGVILKLVRKGAET
jgi:hypothetical protein